MITTVTAQQRVIAVLSSQVVGAGAAVEKVVSVVLRIQRHVGLVALEEVVVFAAQQGIAATTTH